MKRASNLQSMLDAYAKAFDIPQEVNEGADHPYNCRCSICLDYWINIGPDPETGMYGPFTVDEIEFRKHIRKDFPKT